MDLKNVSITLKECAQLREFCIIRGHFAEVTSLTEQGKTIGMAVLAEPEPS